MKLILAFLVCISSFYLQAGNLTVVSYNVENLFDTEHDNGKSDWEFLPKNHPLKSSGCASLDRKYRQGCISTDWTEAKLQLKIENIANVIRYNRTTMPDIIALVEVENEKVVKKLADALGYKNFVVTNSEDERGVDVALLFTDSLKTKLVFRIDHRLRLEGNPTRDILEAQFLVNNKNVFTVFVNHWPSQSNPTSNRLHAAKILQERMENLQRLNPNNHMVAVGDYNTSDEDHPHPFNDQLLLSSIGIHDTHQMALEEQGYYNLLEGTYFYNQHWVRLDRIFITENLTDTTLPKVDVNSFKVLNYEFISKKAFGQFVPYRFNMNGTTSKEMGYSDHYPIEVSFIY